jgi:polysaccharide biosynthesis protein PslH
MRQQDFDLIQFEALEIACYLPIVKQAGTQAKLCFDTFNAEADLQRVIFEIDRQEFKRWHIAIYSYIQSKRIAQYEGALCRMADLVIAVSHEDQKLLSQYRADKPIGIVPSGIFVDDYAVPDASVQLAANAIVFTGKMDYRPNVDAMLWFADSILPHIPQAQLTIVGQQPHPRIQHLAERANISLTGWVDSVQPYLSAAAVYIAPLRMGSGTRLKILEAMATGCGIIGRGKSSTGDCR